MITLLIQTYEPLPNLIQWQFGSIPSSALVPCFSIEAPVKLKEGGSLLWLLLPTIMGASRSCAAKYVHLQI